MTLASLLITTQSASILPVETKSSVQVKSNGQEYAYTIQENKALPLEPLPIIPILNNPFLKIQPQQTTTLVEQKGQKGQELQGQEKLTPGEPLKVEGAELGQIKLELTGLTGGQKLEKPLEHLYIPSYPGYRLIPNTDLQLLEYPYYYPYLSNYAYHYPYVRFL